MATKRGFINLISLLLTGALYSFLATGITTIRPGDQLNVSNTLVSANGIFTLGFFNLRGDSKNTYLGIWYTNRAKRVWVANRDTPIFNNSTVLTIDTTGKLVITSTGDDPITLNSDQATGNATATLEDTGNFVLTDGIEKRVLWQSFDYPTDSLLPGMKLGVNLKTGRNWTLTSWLSSDAVPASGPFTLSWDPTQDSGQLVIRRHGVLYWTSGVLANQAFEFMPGLNTPFSEYNYSLSNVSNQDGKYLTFSLTDQGSDNGSVTSMWVLESSGYIMEGRGNQILNPKWEDDLFCYGYESGSGCASATLPGCRSQHEKFESRTVSFGGTPTDDTNSSLSISDCWARCWNDCGCVGFTNISDNGTGCRIWSGNMEFRQVESGGVPAVYVLVPSNPAKDDGGIYSLLIGVAVGSMQVIFDYTECPIAFL
ncbi:hypothetical protein L1049_008219 [Liquidambar formosana]|uniref:non-specific serine/threonine protein kinase n=1 Tax=Liquidambar formosana TaxID=63359 RepID=A0AAP0S3C0_LIQFO